MSSVSDSSDTHSPGACSSAANADHVLDTSGLYCPEPVMLLHNKIRDIGSGELLRVIATDPSTQRDIPKFCTFLGHALESQGAVDGTFTYFIRKA